MSFVVSWIETSEHRATLTDEQVAELLHVEVEKLRETTKEGKLADLMFFGEHNLEDDLAEFSEEGFVGLTREVTGIRRAKVVRRPKK
jgi:hypothetical protein